MAQIQTLKDRKSGETVYPVSSTKAVFDNKGVDLETRLERQRQAYMDALKDYPTKTAVSQGLAGKQDTLTPSADLQITDDNTIGLTNEFKNSKLNKDVWDAWNEQFDIVGGVLFRTGAFSTDVNWRRTTYIPLNHRYPIKANICIYGINGIAVYDCNLNYLKGWGNAGTDATQNKAIEIPAEEIPANAAYFIVSTMVHHIASARYVNGTTLESLQGATSEAISAAKFALFIDLWNAAWGQYGKYDPVNAPDPQHTFFGNTLWMTYEEAVAVYATFNGEVRSSYDMLGGGTTTVRTLVPIRAYISEISGNRIAQSSGIEVLRFYSSRSYDNVAVACPAGLVSHDSRLHSILCQNGLRFSNRVTFTQCPALTTVEIVVRDYDISFADCPLLSLYSLNFMVTKSTPTKQITVTVHPDVYAKLTDEANTEWHQVLTDALDKNITFATK